MSGIEILGAVAGGLAICTQLAQLGIAVRKAIRRIKNSRRDALDLSDETIVFAGLCTQFLNVCDEDHKANKAIHSSIYRLIHWLKKLTMGLDDILKKVGALLPESTSKGSLEKRCIAYLEWFGSKKEVGNLRASMNIARMSIDGFSNLMCIRKLNEELKMLELAWTDVGFRQRIEKESGMTLDEKIMRVRQSINLHCSVHEVKERVLKSAVEENLKDQERKGNTEFDITTQDLSVFTQGFEKYGKQVLATKAPHPFSGLNNGSSLGAKASQSRAKPRSSSSRNTDSKSTLIDRPSRNPRNIPTVWARTTSSRMPSSTMAEQPIVEVDIMPKAEPFLSQANDKLAGQRLRKERSSREKTTSAPPFYDLVASKDTKSREYINDPYGNILSPPKIKPPEISAKGHRFGLHTIMLSATEFRINNRAFGMTSYQIANDLFNAILRHQDKVNELVKVVDGEYGDKIWNGIPGWLAAPGQVTKGTSDSGIQTLQAGVRGD